ncbi:MAG: hypothetical protein ACP5C3_01885 [Methanomicrobiales archaeon]
MNKYLRIVIFGLIIWLTAFAISFIIYPIRDSMRPLFESIMPVVISMIVTTMAYYYMKNLDSNFVIEGLKIGIAWYILNLALDLLLFIPPSPMQMSLVDYMADIGITYLIIPTITIGYGYLLSSKINIK